MSCMLNNVMYYRIAQSKNVRKKKKKTKLKASVRSLTSDMRWPKEVRETSSLLKSMFYNWS